MAGDDVYALQGRLLDLGFRVGRVDGYFGPETEGGVREFQRNFGIPPDGTCGPATLKALTPALPDGQGRCPQRAARPGAHPRGRSPPRRQDRGDRRRSRAQPARPTYAAVSDAILHDLAQRVEGRLVAIGVQAFLTTPRWADAPGEETDRAGVREPHRRRPVRLAGPRHLHQPRRLRGLDVLLRRRQPRHLVLGRRALRRPGAARDRRPQRPASTCAPTPRPGTCCATPGCRRCASTPAT